MPTNDFLQVAAAGTNVEDQADYAASANRLNGWPINAVPGSAEWNKMMRQSSAIATILAQAVCDISGLDMLDNGDESTQLAHLKTMLALAGSNLSYVVGAGTVNVITIAPGGAAAYKAGESWLLRPSGANTGAVTFNRDALGAKAVVNIDGTALIYGEIPAVGLVEVVYQPTLDKFVLLSSYGPVPTFGEITVGAGNIAIPVGARQCIIEFCGGGGGGGTGDGGSGGPSGTAADGSAGTETIVNGIHAAPGAGGVGGRVVGGVYGGVGGGGGAGAGETHIGQSGTPGTWVTATGLGMAGGVGGSSMLGGGGMVNGGGFVAAGWGGGGGGGQTGQSGSFSGGGGGAAQTRRIILSAATLAGLGGNIAYSIGGAGAGGAAVGNFPGATGGGGYLRFQFNF